MRREFQLSPVKYGSSYARPYHTLYFTDKGHTPAAPRSKSATASAVKGLLK